MGQVVACAPVTQQAQVWSRSGQVSCVRFFRDFSSPVRQMLGSFRPQGPRISFGHHYHHQSSFIMGANDLRCWSALKPQIYIRCSAMNKTLILFGGRGILVQASLFLERFLLKIHQTKSIDNCRYKIINTKHDSTVVTQWICIQEILSSNLNTDQPHWVLFWLFPNH